MEGMEQFTKENCMDGRPVEVRRIRGILLEAVRSTYPRIFGPWVPNIRGSDYRTTAVQDDQGDEVSTAFRSECTRLESIIHPLIVGFKGAFYRDQLQQEVKPCLDRFYRM